MSGNEEVWKIRTKRPHHLSMSTAKEVAATLVIVTYVSLYRRSKWASVNHIPKLSNEKACRISHIFSEIGKKDCRLQ